MNDLELSRLCAKALDLFDWEWYFTPLHNAEQNAQLESWLLREGYWIEFGFCGCVVRKTERITDYGDFRKEWNLDMTIPENRWRAVVEAVARIMEERSGKA